MQEPISKKSSSLAKILLIFLRLGFTSFGGPTAHLGFFRDEFVEKRKWLSDAAFADLVALCQFLPGPASSQVGYAIGLKRGGWLGGAAAWIGFTIPSAVALVLFGLGIAKFGGVTGDDGWLRGLQIAVVAVIAKALWGMARSLCPDRLRAGIAIIATGVMLAFPGAWMQVGVIILGAIAGLLLIKKADVPAVGKNEMEATRLGGPSVAIACLIAFFVLLVGLPIVAGMADQPLLSVFAAFYKTGSLVFGGGHVVLPMLQAETVAPGWITESDFLAGYGAAQAVPGPLFTFSAFLGSMMAFPKGPWIMATVCLVGVFLPSWLMVAGLLPFWEKLRTMPKLRLALAGTNAAVVGLLASALYIPTWTAAIQSRTDAVFLVGVALAFFVLRVPVWAMVILAAIAGGLFL